MRVLLIPIGHEILKLLNQLPVVVQAILGPSHVRVIVIVHCFVETLHVSDEDLSLPLLCRVLRVGVVVQKERELHATSINDALVAFRCLVLTISVTKDSKGQDRRANGIETSALFTWQGSNTSGQSFDLGVVHTLHDV